MKKGCLYMAACFLMATVHGQTEPSSLHKGIMKYKEGKFQEAVAAFTETLNLNDSHRIARYNLGLAWYKANEKEKAAAAFERVAAADKKDDLTIRSIYNKGVLEAGNKNWPASINAFREALRLAPNDEDIRYNLEKAIEENRKTKKQQEEKQKQQERKKQAPPKDAPPSNKKRMEQWLQSLRQKEQEIQRKMQQKNRTSSQPEKDW